MIYFINDQKPEQFTFSTNDPKLQKMYLLILVKVIKHKPFSDYYHNIYDLLVTFKRKDIKESFSMNTIIKTIYENETC